MSNISINNTNLTPLFLAMACMSCALLTVNKSYAEINDAKIDTAEFIIDDSAVSEPNFSDSIDIEEPIEQVAPIETEALPTDEAMSDTTTKMSKEESLQYLKSNPKKLETLLAESIRAGRLDYIEDLLPIYQQYPQRDESLVEWSQALLDTKSGQLDKAIQALRKLNSEFPNVRTLRFQLAMTLLRNGQFNAALSELEKIKSDDNIPEADLKAINSFIRQIKQRDDWSFHINGSYVSDDNINNTPPEGTDYGRGFKASAREEGHGLRYSLFADKKWRNDNKWFTSLNVGSSGTYFWDNKEYSAITGRVGVGVGYQDADKEIELSPYVSKQFYGLGSSDEADGDLHPYKETRGISLSSSFNLDNKWRYSNSLGYAVQDYTEDYKNNNAKDYSFNHTVSYNYSPLTYFYGGVNYFKRDTELEYNSFDRKGVRVGWGQVWPKGFSTRANVGYGKRNYQAHDFFGDKRKNDEYSAGLTVWNRGVSLFGLTPRLNWSYSKTESNSVREEVDSNDFTIDFTKTF